MTDLTVRRPRSATRSRARRGRRWVVLGVVLVGLGVAAVLAGILTEPDVDVAASGAPDLVATTPVLSARRTPEFTSRPVASRSLAQAITPIAASLPPSSCIEVRDGGMNVFESKDAEPVIPASNLKIVTAAAALELLDPESTLTTSFVATSPPQGGVINGDLVVVGGGDPLLTSDPYAAAIDNHGPVPATDLEAVADQLVAAGVTRVTGSVIGDDSRYDAQRSVPSWKSNYVPDREVSPLSALLVNDSSAMDSVAGGPDSAAADPALASATAVSTMLTSRGVIVDGAPRTGKAPPAGTVVLNAASLPVKDLVAQMLEFSDNTTAELLTKEIGLQKGGTGSTEAGVAAIATWLATTGADTTGVTMVDGSGLSRENRATCRVLGDLLARGGADGALAQSLAVPGQPGTLDKRFTSPDLAGRVRAKTGTLDQVTSLSGWETTDPGRNVTFSILINTGGRSVNGTDAAAQTNLLRSILPYPTTPAPELISPAPPAAPAAS